MAVSQATLQGNLIGVELKYSGSGNAYARGRFAVSKGPDEESMWFDFVCFGTLAENLSQTFTNTGAKSLRAVVTGKIEINNYESGEDKDGNAIKRYSTQIIAEDVGISLKYANVGAVAKGYSESVDAEEGVTVTTATEQAPEPTARPVEEIGENEAPF